MSRKNHRSTDKVSASTGADRVLSSVSRNGERLWNALVYSSAYLSVIAMAEVLVVMIVLSLPLSPAPLVVGLVTFAVYTNDRLKDVDSDAISNPRQAAFVRRHRDVLYVLAAIAYGLAVSISILGGPVALGLTLLPGVFWVLYASNWIPDVGTQVRRLKEVLVVNTLVIALGWAVTVTLLPMAFADASFGPTAGVLFVYFLGAAFVQTEIPNVRDIVGDREIGVSTLPVAVGVARTRQLLYALNGFLAAIVSAATVIGYLTPVEGWVLLAGVAYSIGVTAFVGRTEENQRVVMAAESKLLVVWAAFALLSFV